MTEHIDPTDAAPLANSDPKDVFGEPIFVYTRQQAIEDGILVDVTAWAGDGPEGMLGGFTVPVALTHSLWATVDIDNPDERDEPEWRRLARESGESTRGRAHDVLWLAAIAARRARGADRLRYSVLMTTTAGGGRPVQTRLRLEARIDGDGVTIGFPEDF
jgi:hypothetical protein